MALTADTTDMGADSRPAGEAGFGMIELLISMVVLQIALLAIVGAFGAGAFALRTASKVNTASTLADQQMELYRAMPYNAIGLDTAGAPTTGTYIGDTSVCTASQTPVCANIGPVANNVAPVNPNSSDAASTWSCTATSGTTSVSTYFTSNGINPCIAHRCVGTSTTCPTSPAFETSPDGKTYYVDTYIVWSPSTLQGSPRPLKQVSVVVRDGTTTKELAKEVTTFDCSTGTQAGSAVC